MGVGAAQEYEAELGRRPIPRPVNPYSISEEVANQMTSDDFNLAGAPTASKGGGGIVAQLYAMMGGGAAPKVSIINVVYMHFTISCLVEKKVKKF